MPLAVGGRSGVEVEAGILVVFLKILELFQGLVVVPGFVFSQGSGGGGEPDRCRDHDYQESSHRGWDGGHPEFAGLLRKENLQKDEQDGQAQRPMESFMVALDQLLLAFGAGEGCQAVLVEQFHRFRALQTQIKAIACRGHPLENVLLQFGFDHVALVIADVIDPPRIIPGPQYLPLRGADADCEDAHIGFGGRLGGLHRATLVVLSISEQNEHLVVVPLAVGWKGGVDGLRD